MLGASSWVRLLHKLEPLFGCLITFRKTVDVECLFEKLPILSNAYIALAQKETFN